MSTLSSASTDAQIKAAYADNASYSEDGSAAKARAFVTACRLLLLILPKSSGHGGASVALSPELIQAELRDAVAWIGTNDTASNAGVRCLDFGEDFKA